MVPISANSVEYCLCKVDIKILASTLELNEMIIRNSGDDM